MSKTLSALAVQLAVICTVAGCAVTPTVQYSKFDAGASDKPDWDGHQKFKFNASTILVAAAKDEKGNPKPVAQGLSITSVPAEDPRGTVIAIAPSNSLGVRTHLSLTARNNTMLVESVGVEVQDDRIKTIQTIGSIVTGLMAVLDTTPSPFPVTLDVGNHLKDQNSRKPKPLTETFKGGAVNVEFGDLSAGVVEWREFESRLGQDSSTFFYSACRDAFVTVTMGTTVVQRATVRVSDPMFLQTVRFPAKGKIMMHSACGVSVANEAAKVSTDLELLDAVISQVKSIKDAQEKAKSGSGQKQGGK